VNSKYYNPELGRICRGIKSIIIDVLWLSFSQKWNEFAGKKIPWNHLHISF